MVFSSLTFLFLFFPALIFFYYVLPFRTRSSKNLVLLVFSMVFYSWGGWRLAPLILFSVIVNYVFGRLVDKKYAPQRRKIAVVGAITCNIGLLIFFKYLGFLTRNINYFIPSVPVCNILLPIGISFYTFQSLSYVIDVYRGEVEPEKNILHVALYIVLFPQLVAGPIVRYTTIADEIMTRTESIDNFYHGMTRFLFGLAKKVLIANQVAQIADAAFEQGVDYLSMGLAWLGVFSYSIQIYFDFSGYSDMAIGLGRMFGFHFLENFNYPYISRSITDFWRRWHISLSTWFRDYLYIPLGGNRCSKKRQIFNLLLVWGLTGLWHGAEWNFICWGLYYALLLIGERYLWGGILEKLPSAMRHLYTLLLVMVGWLVFRASGVTQICSFLKSMFAINGTEFWNDQATYLVLEYRWELIIAIIASLPLKIRFQDFIATHQDNKFCVGLSTFGVPIFSLFIGMLSIVFLVSSGFNPFIYFQF